MSRRPQMMVIQSRNAPGWGYCVAGSGLERMARLDTNPAYPTSDDAIDAIRRDRNIPKSWGITLDPDPDATVRLTDMGAALLEGSARA